MKYYACCSFGKDSLATILLAKQHNEPLDEVLYTEVMFDETTSGENPDHIKWIREVAIPKVESLGYPVKVLRANDCYKNEFERVKTRSRREERNGKMQGFPLSMACYCNRNLKVKPMKDYLKGKECIQYVGIAIDEPKRLERLTQNKVSLLAKYGYTEKMAYELCEKNDLLSPLYKTATRGGCWFCPNASKKELKCIVSNHADIWQKLVDLYFNNKDRLIRTQFNWSLAFEDLDRLLKQEEKQQKFDFYKKN